MSGGFYKRRRGILEHLEAGTISLLDSAVHDYLSMKMNGILGSACKTPPGAVFSCSKAIHATCPKGISERAIRRSLEHLEKLGWIKRWKKAGKRGNYPVLIARASVHDVSGNEYRLSIEETTDWRYPILHPVDNSATTWPREGHEASGVREVRIENREKPKAKPAAKTAQPADPRFQPFVDFAFQSYEVKYGQKPNWNGKDFKHLKVLLSRNQILTAAELERRWNHYSASTEPFTAKQGGSLAYFCSKFDSFIAAPILETSGGEPEWVRREKEQDRKRLESVKRLDEMEKQVK